MRRDRYSMRREASILFHWCHPTWTAVGYSWTAVASVGAGAAVVDACEGGGGEPLQPKRWWKERFPWCLFRSNILVPWNEPRREGFEYCVTAQRRGREIRGFL